MRFLRAVAGLVAVAWVVLDGRPAQAECKPANNFASFGGLLSIAGRGESWYTAVGAEGSFVHYGDTSPFGVGAVLQIETVSFDHFRITFGPQVNYAFVGTELGLAVEGADDEGHATTVSLHFAPFLSWFGGGGPAFRLGVPLMTLSSGDRYPTEYGGQLTLKVPVGLDGALFCVPTMG